MKTIDTKYKVGDAVYTWSFTQTKVVIRQFIVSSIKIDISKKQGMRIVYLLKGAGVRKHEEHTLCKDLLEVKYAISSLVDEQIENFKVEKPKGKK